MWHHLDSLRPSDAYMSVSLPLLVEIMACHLVSTKPSSKSKEGILLIWTLGTNFSEISIEIHRSSFKKMHLKMSFVKCLPFCPSPNVLMILEHVTKGSHYLFLWIPVFAEKCGEIIVYVKSIIILSSTETSLLCLSSNSHNLFLKHSETGYCVFHNQMINSIQIMALTTWFEESFELKGIDSMLTNKNFL